MTRSQLIKVIGDVLALVLSAALIIATVIAINARIASASYEAYEESAIMGKYVEENPDAVSPWEFVLAHFEAPGV